MKVHGVYNFMKSTLYHRGQFGIETFSCGQYEKLVNQMLTNRKSVCLEHFDMFFKFIVL